MAMVINHNIPALTTYNTVNRTNAALEKSIQKLSTGLRINSAADDAAGLAISEKMRSQINGMDRAVSNAQDGISMIQVAEGALNETHSILQRMRELSVQAANDTLTSQDRGYIQMEIDQLREEVTRIGNTTQFNKKKLLNGDAAVLWSSSDLETKAVVNGGLRQIDQFGQKSAAEGNYKINIKSQAGQAEVQKSDLFKIKHPNVVMNKSLNSVAGVTDVAVNNVPAGSYSVTSKGGSVEDNSTSNIIMGTYGIASKISKNTAASKDTLATIQAGGTNFTVKDLGLDGTSATAADKANIGKYITINDGTNDIVKVKLESGMTAKAIMAEVDRQLNSASPKGYQILTGKDASGKYEITAFAADGTAPTLTITDGTGKLFDTPSGPTDTNVTLESAITTGFTENDLLGNASVLFEVTNVDLANKSITLKGTANITGLDGSSKTTTIQDVVLVEGATAATNLDAAFLGGTDTTSALSLKLNADMSKAFSVGDKFVYGLAKKTGADIAVNVDGTQNTDWPDAWGVNTTNNPQRYGFKAASVQNSDIHMKNYYLNEKTGEATLGDVILSVNDKFNATNAPDGTQLASFDAAYIGQVAKGDVKLRDLDKFWDSQGVFMLNDSQTITLTQGDGTSTSVTLYANDTLDDVAKKLNNAIATGLGQGKYVNDASQFVNYVEDGSAGTAESVPGTFVIRSVVPGESGKISLSGDENIINAFSLNTIQEEKESKYTIEVKDAHTDTVLASGIEISGNKLMGVVNPNVDVEFDAMAGVSATWDEKNKVFRYSSKDYSTVLHLSDNTTVFQIGANEGEDMGVNIGDMRASALGLDKVLVNNRESAARSITILDNAIDKVSTQRAKLGAYQNRLEHTINNLNTASENITAAESRIRDTDMAKEMMNFTKLQIMLQAGTSMLAQANQLPQNVMALVR